MEKNAGVLKWKLIGHLKTTVVMVQDIVWHVARFWDVRLAHVYPDQQLKCSTEGPQEPILCERPLTTHWMLGNGFAIQCRTVCVLLGWQMCPSSCSRCSGAHAHTHTAVDHLTAESWYAAKCCFCQKVCQIMTRQNNIPILILPWKKHAKHVCAPTICDTFCFDLFVLTINDSELSSLEHLP